MNYIIEHELLSYFIFHFMEWSFENKGIKNLENG